jgi:DNA repair exonuclease SbcCD nuclease subunit
VLCVPHLAALSPSEAGIRADDRFRYNILAVHGQLPGRPVTDFGGAALDWGALSAYEWDYVALGHSHRRATALMNAEYPGSLERTSSLLWDDGGAKGFLEVVLPAGRREFHQLTSPRDLLILDPIDARGLGPEELQQKLEETIGAVKGGIDGKIVRLEVRNVPRETFRLLDHRVLREWRSRALNFTLMIHPPKGPTAGAPHLASLRAGTLREELEEFCGRWRSSDVPAADLMKRLLRSLTKDEEARDEAREP